MGNQEGKHFQNRINSTNPPVLGTENLNSEAYLRKTNIN